MTALSLVFDLIGRDVSASKAFKDVGDSAEKAGKQGEGVGSLISGGMKMAAGALLGGGIIEGFKSLYDAAAESAKIGRITTQVIQSTGGAAKVTADQVGDLVTAISNKTGVDDEAIQSGANLLLTFTNIKNEAGKGNDIFTQTTQIMTDMSVALGTDASGSAIQLGKALNDPVKGVTALQKVGVSFTASQKDQIKTLVESGNVMGAQKVILAELSKEFGGAAAAASTPLDKLKVTAGNLAEQIGGYLIPIVDKFATFLLTRVLPVVSDLAGWVGDHLGSAFKVAGQAINGIAGVVEGVVKWFTDLPGPIQLAVGALGAIALLHGPVSLALTAIKSGIETVALKMMYLGSAGSVAKAGMGGLMGLFGGPWGLALAAVAGGVAFLVSGLNQESDATKRTAAATKTLTDALNQSNGAINESVRMAAAQSAQQAGLFDAAQRWGVSTKTVTDAILGNKDAMNQVTTAAGSYKSGIDDIAKKYGEYGVSANNSRQQTQDWMSSLQALGGTTQGTLKEQSDLAKAAGATGNSMAAATGQAADWTKGLQDETDSASNAKKATDLFKTSLDILTGQTVDMNTVTAQFYDSLASADGALKTTKGSVLDATGALNLQTESGRKVNTVLASVRDTGNTLISTMIQQGKTSDEVNAKDAELRDAFYKTALQMTGNKKAAELLTAQYYGIPGDRTTTIIGDTQSASKNVSNLDKQTSSFVNAPHVATVDANTQPARTQLEGLVKDWTNRFITIPGFSSAGNIGGGGNTLRGYATGGFTGNGGKYEPKGVVHGGEFVFTQEETKAAGVDRLYALAKSLRGYAAGGLVGSTIRVSSNVAQAGINALNKMMEPAATAAGALNWAKSQVGKPYIWGAAGPAGYDCSGFMSALTNVLHGRSPYSRVGSTANFPWSGFSPGVFGRFSIGSTPDAGDGIGHMAGTLMGVNVESRGDSGVHVGGSARGARDGLFRIRASMYDDGGWLQPGYTLAANGTGKPERIRTAEQEAALQRELSGGQSVVGIVVNGDVHADPDQLANRARIGTQRALATYGVRT